MTSWGRLGATPHNVVPLRDPVDTRFAISHQNHRGGVARGMGRSYGDVCLNPGGTLWTTEKLNKFISFNTNNGRLRCEAGVLLRDIQRMVIPYGWALPVTPGTQVVSVGGAIANDVHGKNHHVHGSFGNHVKKICLVRTDGEVISCGPENEPDWFAATVGGMGLTGVITQAEIQLRRVASPWLDTETIAFANLSEFFQLADDSETHCEYTVSWIDCISGVGGRGLFMRGNHADGSGRKVPKSSKLTIPFVPPVSLVNKLSLRPFNMAYFHLNKWKAGKGSAYYESFFCPLDNLLEWNRMYGPRGFYQYQSVIPRRFAYDAIEEMLKEIARSGDGSFLAVLKTFGNRQSLGMMSFPMSGATLALDFPNHGNRTHKLFERLDAIVCEASGRIYPAKDARMPRDVFEAGFPRLNEFMKFRDPGISSGLSRRLMGS